MMISETPIMSIRFLYKQQFMEVFS